MRLLALLLAMLLVVGAGCAGAREKPQDSQSPSQSEMPSSGSPTPTTSVPGPRVNTSFFEIVLSGCELVTHSMYVQENVVGPQYPPGITPRRNDAGLQLMDIDYWKCRQAADGILVQDGFEFFALNGVIESPRAAEANVTVPFYLFQSYTNSKSLAENATKKYGVTIEYVDSFALERTPLNPPPYPTFAYKLTVTPSRPDYTLEGHWWEGTPNPEKEVFGYYFQNATGALGRFEVAFEGNSRGSSAGTASFGSGSYWAQHFEAPSWDFVNLAYSDVAAILSFRQGI